MDLDLDAWLSDADLHRWGVPEGKMGRFRDLLASGIRDLLRPRKDAGTPSRPTITPHLDKLLKALEPLRSMSPEEGDGYAAGNLLQGALIRPDMLRLTSVKPLA